MSTLEAYVMLCMMYNNQTSSEKLNDAILDALDVAWVGLTEDEKSLINGGKPVFDLD